MRYCDYAAIEDPVHARIALTAPPPPAVSDRRAG
jgi:hypothetical protein